MKKTKLFLGLFLYNKKKIMRDSDSCVICYVLGVLLMLVGVGCIIYTILASEIIVQFFSIALSVKFLTVFYNTFKHAMVEGAAVAELQLSFVYVTMAFFILLSSPLGAMGIDLALSIQLVLAGCVKIFIGHSKIVHIWKVACVNGYVSLAMGITAIVFWFLSNYFLVGIFIGVDIFIYGLYFLLRGYFPPTLIKKTNNASVEVVIDPFANYDITSAPCEPRDKIRVCNPLWAHESKNIVTATSTSIIPTFTPQQFTISLSSPLPPIALPSTTEVKKENEKRKKENDLEEAIKVNKMAEIYLKELSIQ